jgi:glycosyltransferase involved in cell wall biosynthesis
MSGAPRPYPARDEVRFTYAGTLGIANGLGAIVRAAALLQNDPAAQHIRVRIIGNGPAGDALRALGTELNVGNVEFVAGIPKHAVYDELGDADAGIMILQDSPVFRWGISPNKLFDYLGAARPVLFAVNTPYNPVADANAGITVNPADPASIADGMRTLASWSRDERQRAGQRGREYVEAHHSVQALANKFESVFAEVVR